MGISGDDLPRTRVVRALSAGALIAAVTATFTVGWHPLGGGLPLESWVDVVFTLLLIPFALALLAVLLALRAAQSGRDGVVGRVGTWVTGVAVAGFVVCAVATIITGDPMSTGLLYPLSMLVSLAGLVLAAVGSARAKVHPWWLVPLITLGWIFGGPLAESGGEEGPPFGFPGASFILAGVYAVAAAACLRYGVERQPARDLR